MDIYSQMYGSEIDMFVELHQKLLFEIYEVISEKIRNTYVCILIGNPNRTGIYLFISFISFFKKSSKKYFDQKDIRSILFFLLF